MNRKKIFEFVDQKQEVLICGKGKEKEFEALCWYLDNNAISYSIYEPKSGKIVSEKTGIFWMESDEHSKEWLPELKNTKAELFCLSELVLQEVRCMYIISTPHDKEEAEILLEAVRKGKLNDDIIAKCTYAGLMYIKNFFAEEEYLQVYDAVCTINKKRIDKQDKVRVGFLVKHSSEWSTQSIYDKMKDDPRYEVKIFVAPYWVGTQRSIMDNYNNTLSYFKGQEFPVIGMYDEKNDSYMQWDKENKCDYMFNLSANFICLRKTTCMVKFPLSTLNMYIPYGFYISGFVESAFNLLSHAMCWKVFCESRLHKEMAAVYGDIGDRNVEYSGYLKMDCYLQEEQEDMSELWSIPEECDAGKMKKIVYAPHWSIGESSTKYGSFEKIYNDIYEYAKATRDKISWIIKPHPRLRSECVVQGVFKTEQEYDAYIEKWNALDNARAVTVGTYEKIFMSSDGMVLDSISFTAEYMYVHKPMVFLTREDQTVNKFGEKLMATLNKVDGGDMEAIIEEIEEVILGGKDPKKEVREEFFETYLNYYKANKMCAADYIMRLL